MAQITITVPDAVVLRIRQAFGLDGQLATLGEITDAVKLFVKSRVIAYESRLVRKDIEKLSNDKAQAISQEIW